MYPSGRIVGCARDALGRVTGLTTWANAGGAVETVALSIAYLPFGPLTGLAYGSGLVHARAYDLDYRLTALATTGTGGVQVLGYGYDDNPNVTAINDNLDAARSQGFAMTRSTG